MCAVKKPPADGWHVIQIILMKKNDQKQLCFLNYLQYRFFERSLFFGVLSK